MARLILDTTMIVSTEQSGRWLNSIIDDDDDVVIAAVTAAELLVGILLANEARRDDRRRFVEQILTTVPIEDYDLAVARAHAELLAHVRQTGRPRGAHDLMIAATARATTRTVVSSDTRAFADLPGVAHRP